MVASRSLSALPPVQRGPTKADGATDWTADEIRARMREREEQHESLRGCLQLFVEQTEEGAAEREELARRGGQLQGERARRAELIYCFLKL